MAADLACPQLLWPEIAACARGSCDGSGHCVCGEGTVGAGDFTGMFGTACFDIKAIQALYILTIVSTVGVMLYCVLFIQRVCRGNEHKFGRALLGGLGIAWGMVTITLSIVRTARLDWVIGQNVLPTVLFSILYILFWQFTFSIILRVVVLAQRVSLFAQDEHNSHQALVRRSRWIYALFAFAVAVNLAPIFMLVTTQLPNVIQGLGVYFFVGNVLVCALTGIVALRAILLPLCNMFRKHESNQQVAGNSESANQLKRVVEKMDKFAKFIQILSIGTSGLLFLPSAWPIILRSTVYLIPVNTACGGAVIAASINLFWPVSKNKLQTSATGITAVATVAEGMTAAAQSNEI